VLQKCHSVAVLTLVSPPWGGRTLAEQLMGGLFRESESVIEG
jgi:hypothetical protein